MLQVELRSWSFSRMSVLRRLGRMWQPKLGLSDDYCCTVGKQKVNEYRRKGIGCVEAGERVRATICQLCEIVVIMVMTQV